MCTEHMIIQCAMTFPHIACQLRLLTWHSSFSFFLKVHSAKMTIPLPCMQPASMHTKALAGHHAQPRSCSLPRAHRFCTSNRTRRQGKHICRAAKGNGKPAIQGEGAAWMASNLMQSQVWREALPMEAAMSHPHRLYSNCTCRAWPGPHDCKPCNRPHVHTASRA